MNEELRKHNHKECTTQVLRIVNDPKCKGFILVAKLEGDDGEDQAAVSICQLSKDNLAEAAIMIMEARGGIE